MGLRPYPTTQSAGHIMRRSAALYGGIASIFEYTGPSKTMEAKAAGEAVMDAFIAEMLTLQQVRADRISAKNKRDWLPLTSRAPWRTRS